MERRELESVLGAGFSLEEIGRLYGKDHSTIGYWVKKLGLRAAHADRFAPRGPLSRYELSGLVEQGLTTQEIADSTGRSCSTVR